MQLKIIIFIVMKTATAAMKCHVKLHSSTLRTVAGNQCCKPGHTTMQFVACNVAKVLVGSFSTSATLCATNIVIWLTTSIACNIVRNGSKCVLVPLHKLFQCVKTVNHLFFQPITFISTKATKHPKHVCTHVLVWVVGFGGGA